ncbi:unnamed protein product [Soboliphyme baturini]|uniref:WH2 domain-containing protein n=1 Tax=Soboliphyme baturini TaxID=241478 RepID=A0A183IVQ0_9BILA|nr:unnamed protein product [Soboliphyme baturini]
MPLPPPPPPAPALSNALSSPSAVASQGCATLKDRSALLAEIRKAGGGGIKLRPTKTVDKSVPLFGSPGLKSGNCPASTVSPAPISTPRPKLNFADELNQTLSGGHDRIAKKHGAQTLKPSSSPSRTPIGVGSGGSATLRPARHNGGSTPMRPKYQDDSGVTGVPFRGRPRNDDSRQPVGRPLPALPSKPPPLPKKTVPTSNSGSPRPVPRPASAKLHPSEPSHGISAEHGESSVSVKALTEKWQDTTASASASSLSSAVAAEPHGRLRHGAKSTGNLQATGLDESTLVHGKSEENGRQRSSVVRPTTDTIKPRPPLPRKPPSEKPTMQHRKDMVQKFRTLKPQQSALARPVILKSTSNEELAEPQNVLVKNKLSGTENRSVVHRQLPHPPLPPSVMQRPDFAPPPPPPQASNKPPPFSELPARQIHVPNKSSSTSPHPTLATAATPTDAAADRHSTSSDSRLPPPPVQAFLVNAKWYGDQPNNNHVDATPPAPPPRTDVAASDDMERNFTFRSIRDLPLPPRFMNLRKKNDLLKN